MKEDENIAELRQKSQDFDTLLYSLKEKYKEVDRQKIDSDSDPGTTFMVLLRSEGLFSSYRLHGKSSKKNRVRERNFGASSSKEKKAAVTGCFRLGIVIFCDDEHSRIMPGKKDVVSITQKGS